MTNQQSRKELRDRSDAEYTKYLRSHFQADILNRVIITPFMRKTLAYSFIQLRVSFQILGETIKEEIQKLWKK